MTIKAINTYTCRVKNLAGVFQYRGYYNVTIYNMNFSNCHRMATPEWIAPHLLPSCFGIDKKKKRFSLELTNFWLL